jgi:hypothetical protein
VLRIKSNKLAIIDEAKRLRSVATLKVDRLVVGAVDMHDLTWIKAHSNPRRCGHAGVSIRFVIDNGVDGAATVVWFVERYDAFIAKRRQNWLMSPNRPQVLHEFIGSCRETEGSEGNESTHRGDPQTLPSIERVHCRSPSKHWLKWILSLEKSLAHLSKIRCGVCHTRIVRFVTHHCLLMRLASLSSSDPHELCRLDVAITALAPLIAV